MSDRLVHPRGPHVPLPVRNGLTATRARLPDNSDPISAANFLNELISSQRHRHPDDNESALLERFQAGQVRLRNGTILAPESLVSAGQDVFFYRTPAPETPVPYDIEILHRDNDLLVVDKPPYLATMPRGRHITETVTVRLRRDLDLPDLVPAHRLDRLTSGVLMFTLRKEVRGAYQSLFAQRKVAKAYEAIATLDPDLASSTPVDWASQMTKQPGDIQGHIVEGEPNAFTQLVDVAPLSQAEQLALEQLHGPLPPQARYLLHPETGRTHQLRLHMWAAGVPILGDPVYPRIYSVEEEDMSVPMHLRARSLSFIDPLSGLLREFWAPRQGHLSSN
ncbi:pseudouridine synthase [Corynebacterium alimapuense]|uniref:RNA pseudouridylate synthase n=1 Tax=Corynebacterium alimapuense TaxID=1576874 RepID=A0A3M8KA05_9CORY|nr:pseudouridine synthase [Corynebacterium alimapuense]RNE50047.1 23S rRNA pseudouridylate synthase [Corynebacterium alimapuense]